MMGDFFWVGVVNFLVSLAILLCANHQKESFGGYEFWGGCGFGVWLSFYIRRMTSREWVRKSFKKKIFHACNWRACYLRQNKQTKVLFFCSFSDIWFKCWSFWSKKDCDSSQRCKQRGKCSVICKEERGGRKCREGLAKASWEGRGIKGSHCSCGNKREVKCR